MSVQTSFVHFAPPVLSNKAKLPARERADFILSEWHHYNEFGRALIKKITYSSKSSGSFFQEVMFLCYLSHNLPQFSYLKDGQIAINITFRKDLSTVEKAKYMEIFRKAGIFLDERLLEQGYCQVVDRMKREHVFRFLIQNNRFPVEQIEFIKSLAEVEDWRQLKFNKDFKDNCTTRKMLSKVSSIITQQA